MYSFCTYFDQHYLSRGLVLHQSLVTHCPDFKLFVLCLDDLTHELLLKADLPGLVPVHLGVLEAWEPRLLEARTTRSVVEYYFTLSPVLPLYVLQTSVAPVVTYLDADLCFYSSPESLYAEFSDGSILVTSHRFPKHLLHKEEFGAFNVQYLSFRNDSQGMACLTRWRDQCLEWCHDRLEEGRFADQKYLDEWPDRYDRLVVSRDIGVGVAPWNISGCRLDNGGADHWLVDDTEVVFYHFHGFNFVAPGWATNNIGEYGFGPNRRMARRLYRDYASRLKTMEATLATRTNCKLSLTNPRRRRGRLPNWLRALRHGSLMRV
ncbi:MAG: hypothetical protein DRI90_07865 [Deltaproteobacteria bacterium]|nr:MAG: hypothetical protein DRI90_07865 [Deltaproteobacteria bacterium]